MQKPPPRPRGRAPGPPSHLPGGSPPYGMPPYPPDVTYGPDPYESDPYVTGPYPPAGRQAPPGYRPLTPPGPSATYGRQSAVPIDKRTGAALSYLLWWITGIIFLYVGRSDPDVRYHAAQSTIFFGAVTGLELVVQVVGSVIGALAVPLGIAMFGVIVFAIAVWGMCLYRAIVLDGARFELPWVHGVVTPYAEQLSGSLS
jgi:uncharacterized membrane protein